MDIFSLSPTFIVIITNFLKKQKTATITILNERPQVLSFSCFITKGNGMIKKNGYNAMVTMQSWMFLSSFENMRKKILDDFSIIDLLHMDNMVMGIAFGTSATVFRKKIDSNYIGTYNQITLKDINKNGTPNSFPVSNNRFNQIPTTNFLKIPGSPIAYWVSGNILNAFEKGMLADYADTKQGFATGDNNRFLKFWHEIAWNKVGIDCDTNEEAKESRKKWFPANKGGSYRRWYGNNYYVANWENDGQEMKAFSGSVIRNSQYYFRQGITWSSLSSAGVSMRFSPKGFLFESKGSMCYFKNDDNLPYILALMNTKIVDEMLLILAPTLDYHEGPMSKVPTVIDVDKKDVVGDISKNNITIAKNNWDSYETSWDFKRNPLI